MAELSIPELVNDADMVTAALAYAKAGWYVLPVDPATKHPGSRVGKGWPAKSSREPAQIVAWFAGSSDSLALHCGRSGAVAFDADRPELMPPALLDEIERAKPAMQRSRVGDDKRGHYVFRQPLGRSIGNGTGKLGGAWGEVRGRNGVIIAAPTPHSKAAQGGEYRWLRTGVVPVLGESVAALLPDQTHTEDAATDEETKAFLARHTAASRPEMADAVLKSFRDALANGEGRHPSAVNAVCWAMREAQAGLYDARAALESMWYLFRESLEREATRYPAAEWAGIVSWAVAQAKLDDAQARAERAQGRVVGSVGKTHHPASMVTPPDLEESHDDFWSARPALADIRSIARERLVSPWATLGGVLAHVCTRIGPHVVLPAIVGGVASLNTFWAFVGASGGGKDATLAVASELLGLADAVPTHEVGTGQGIDSTFTEQTKGGPVQFCDAALFTATEIDTLASHAAMGGATVMATLRKVYSGAALGARYADKFKRRPVAAHAYRAAVVAGVQPARSGVLLGDADGGTPQRWIWLPTNDPGATGNDDQADAIATAPGVWAQYEYTQAYGDMGDGIPVPRRARVEIAVCDTARSVIVEHRRARLTAPLHGESGDMRGHALLTQLKVAALLALFDGGRAKVLDEDWHLAAAVMAVSDATRDVCAAVLADSRRRSNVARAVEEVERGDFAADHAEKRVAAALLRSLRRRGVPMPRSDLRRSLPARDRGLFEAGVERLRAAGQLTEEVSDRGVLYRCPE